MLRTVYQFKSELNDRVKMEITLGCLTRGVSTTGFITRNFYFERF